MAVADPPKIQTRSGITYSPIALNKSPPHSLALTIPLFLKLCQQKPWLQIYLCVKIALYTLQVLKC
jgi:hypothetical protein